jgi:nicotinamide mononucleotide (NMN) deamidase PncC
MDFPDLDDFKITPYQKKLIEKIEVKVEYAAYNLLKIVNQTYLSSGVELQIATSESLTGGLIMSSLVNMPIAGRFKYGCFGVYDVDAKRVFNSVKVHEIYSHRCAKEMAIGLLKNSNATFAISVTGNAMPYFDNLDRLGEVFIGIASYGMDDNKLKILYSTYSINTCIDTEDDDFKNLCKTWLKSQPSASYYPSRKDTSTINRLVRNYTAYIAMKKSVDFIIENNKKLFTPPFIAKRKEKNNEKKGCEHYNIPLPKYSEPLLLEVCTSNNTLCNASKSCYRSNINVISLHKIKTKKNKTKKIKPKKIKPKKIVSYHQA